MPGLLDINRRDKLGKIFLACWATGLSIVLTPLMSSHIIPFANIPARAQAVHFTHALSGTSEGWQMLHLVADGCLCSGDVIEHLLERGREHRVAAEAVALIGHRPDLERRFIQAGFAYREISPSRAMETTGIEAAPTLVIMDEQGNIRYTGGYYERRERTKARDQFALTEIMAGRPIKAMPIFGCAFSKKMQAAVDPLGLKYPSNFPIRIKESSP